MDPLYLTTAIDYANAQPHLGHAYEKVLTDTLARYARRQGRKVRFLSGLDEHGQKVQHIQRGDPDILVNFHSNIGIGVLVEQIPDL